MHIDRCSNDLAGEVHFEQCAHSGALYFSDLCSVFNQNSLTSVSSVPPW